MRILQLRWRHSHYLEALCIKKGIATHLRTSHVIQCPLKALVSQRMQPPFGSMKGFLPAPQLLFLRKFCSGLSSDSVLRLHDRGANGKMQLRYISGSRGSKIENCMKGDATFRHPCCPQEIRVAESFSRVPIESQGISSIKWKSHILKRPRS